MSHTITENCTNEEKQEHFSLDCPGQTPSPAIAAEFHVRVPHNIKSKKLSKEEVKGYVASVNPADISLRASNSDIQLKKGSKETNKILLQHQEL